MKQSTTKRIIYIVMANAVAWVWCSYLLAFLGRVEIAESLSNNAITTIIATVSLYCLKALFEKTKAFGSVGQNRQIDGNTYD